MMMKHWILQQRHVSCLKLFLFYNKPSHRHNHDHCGRHVIILITCGGDDDTYQQPHHQSWCQCPYPICMICTASAASGLSSLVSFPMLVRQERAMMNNDKGLLLPISSCGHAITKKRIRCKAQHRFGTPLSAATSTLYKRSAIACARSGRARPLDWQQQGTDAITKACTASPQRCVCVLDCWRFCTCVCAGDCLGFLEEVVPHAPLLALVVVEQLRAREVEEPPVDPPLDRLVLPVGLLHSQAG